MISIKTFKKLALSYPAATEHPHFEKTSFRVNKKIFATLDIKNMRACLLLSPMDQSVFSTFDKSVIYPVPNKWGLKGATYFELNKLRFSMLKDAITQAYKKIVSSKKH